MAKAKMAELFPFKEYQVTLRNKNVVLYVHNVTIYGTKCFTTDFRISLQNHKSQHKKKNKVAYAYSKESDQGGQLPSLIRVFAVC